MRRFLFLLALVESITVCLVVFSNTTSIFLPFLWIFSILLFLTSVLYGKKRRIPTLYVSRTTIFIILLIFLPLLVRILYFSPSRIHMDDVITAYFSETHNFLQINFFSGIPTNKGMWVSQFPTVFFILQRLFFELFGKSFMLIKYSILPYVFINSFFLYLIGKELRDKKTGAIAVIFYAFSSPSLYLETLGLHFVSSTAVFLIFFYACLCYLKKPTTTKAAVLGIITGVNYLFYLTSFIALPIMLLVFFMSFFKQKILQNLKDGTIALIGFLLVFSPFLIYAGFINNYFTSRTNQVSLLSGSWSGEKAKIEEGKSPLLAIQENALLSLQSLSTDGIGGHGGYNFGHLALFNQINLILILLGGLIGSILIWQNSAVALSFLIIVVSFIVGMVLTIPPPAYHRASLAFPFLTLIMSLPFSVLLRIRRIPMTIGVIITIAVVFFSSFQNIVYFLKQATIENDSPDIKLTSYINTTFPNRHIYMASFPGFVFERVYYFSPNQKALSIQTDYHDNFMRSFKSNEKYLYVMTMPEIFEDKFKSLDPNGTIIKYSPIYSLFVN